MGALNRRIAVSSRPYEARAAVEDDFHHFRVRISHDGSLITGAEATALRRPWSTCELAGVQLQRLIGSALWPSAGTVLRYTDQRHQCTHMYDLAALAVAAASQGIVRRSYEAVVPDRVNGQTEPVLRRDGAEALRWQVSGSRLTGPAPFRGLNLGAGFATWVGANLQLEQAEAALILRRAVFISGGRSVDLDRMQHPSAGGGCFAQQPERAGQGVRMIGSTHDFTARAEQLLSGDEDWLAFAGD